MTGVEGTELAPVELTKYQIMSYRPPYGTCGLAKLVLGTSIGNRYRTTLANTDLIFWDSDSTLSLSVARLETYGPPKDLEIASTSVIIAMERSYPMMCQEAKLRDPNIRERDRVDKTCIC